MFSFLIAILFACNCWALENSAGNFSISFLHWDPIYSLSSQYVLARGVDNFRNSFILHAIKLSNNSNSEVTLGNCSIIIKSKGRKIQETFYDKGRLSSESKLGLKFLQSIRSPELSLASVYQSVPFFQGKFTEGLALKSAESILITNQYFDIYAPDKLDEIEVACKLTNGQNGSAVIKLAEYRDKNKFIFPMKGKFIIGGGPYEIWGHRTFVYNEFASDIIPIGKNGSHYSNNPFELKDHYCFGKDVLSPADGTILESFDNLPDNPIPYDRKTTSEFLEKLKATFTDKNLRGNYLLVDHGQNELSLFGHLKLHSIRVKNGQRIKAGQKIAECGNSGVGSAFPHLHYALIDDPDLSKARGLPIQFENVESSIFIDEGFSKMGIPIEFKGILISAGFNPISTINLPAK
jgi:hypothetical protein